MLLEPSTSAGIPLRVINVLIGPDTSGASACFLEYTIATKTFRLLADNGASWLGPVTARSAGTLSNRQCTLHAFTSYGEQYDLRNGWKPQFLTLTIEPKGLRGLQRFFVQSSDPATGAKSEWKQWDTVDFGNNFGPDLPAFNPVSGGGDTGIFTASFKQATPEQHYLGYLLLLPTPNVVQFTARGSCLIEYNRISHGVRLIDDAGTGWLGPSSGVPIAAGAPTLSNSYCSVDVANIAAGVDWLGEMTMRVPVKLKPSLGPVVGTFVQGFDVNGFYSDMRQFGTWTNPGGQSGRPGPYIVSASATHVGQRTVNISLKATHTSGLNAIGMMHVRIAPGIIASQPCHLVYFPSTNSINLINAAQNAMVGMDVKVGSQSLLSNGYCSVDAAKVTASLSGNANLTVPMSFVYPGLRRGYVNVFDNAGLLTHWMDAGTIDVQ